MALITSGASGSVVGRNRRTSSEEKRGTSRSSRFGVFTLVVADGAGFFLWSAWILVGFVVGRGLIWLRDRWRQGAGRMDTLLR